jgi:hypothetical protein
MNPAVARASTGKELPVRSVAVILSCLRAYLLRRAWIEVLARKTCAEVLEHSFKKFRLPRRHLRRNTFISERK